MQKLSFAKLRKFFCKIFLCTLLYHSLLIFSSMLWKVMLCCQFCFLYHNLSKREHWSYMIIILDVCVPHIFHINKKCILNLKNEYNALKPVLTYFYYLCWMFKIIHSINQKYTWHQKLILDQIVNMNGSLEIKEWIASQLHFLMVQRNLSLVASNYEVLIWPWSTRTIKVILVRYRLLDER